MTDEELARKIGINRATFYDWKSKFPDISDAIKKGKEVIDFEVEQALLKRALGVTIKETRREVDANGKKRVIEIVREVAPDTTAQIFWLKNRMPHKWRDKPIDDSEIEDIDATRNEVYGDADA